MNKLERILLFIVSLLVLSTSFVMFALLFPVPYVSDTLAAYLVFENWLGYYLIGFSVVLMIAFLVLFFISILAPASSHYLTINKAKGKIKISKEAIESTARYAVSDLIGNNAIDVKAKLNKRSHEPKIQADVYVDDADDITGLANNIQQNIYQTVGSTINQPVKSVKVKVHEMDARSKGAHRQVL